MLALYGGDKVKKEPFTKGKRFGKEELINLEKALNQNTLFYWHGNMVKELTNKFKTLYNMPYCVATSSGTSAIHTALAALGVTEGDEVITTPLTDMGTVIGILFQNAIPVFCDIDISTYNMTAKEVEKKITDKTKAVIIVHLAGNPADTENIVSLCKERKIKVIEDCAQSYLAYENNKLCGTFGDASCFSLNEFKQISAGDGGLILLKDESLYKKAFRFADKNYNRYDMKNKNISYIAPNYRMNELTGAVGSAQVDKLESICKRRTEIGNKITEGIKNIKGIFPPLVSENNISSYWFYMMRIDEKAFKVSIDEFCRAINAEGLLCQKGYIDKLLYEHDIFKNKSAYIGTHSPFDSSYYKGDVNYNDICKNARIVNDEAIKFNISEFYSDKDVLDIIKIIKKVSEYYLKK